jgi:hypothetical protein
LKPYCSLKISDFTLWVTVKFKSALIPESRAKVGCLIETPEVENLVVHSVRQGAFLLGLQIFARKPCKPARNHGDQSGIRETSQEQGDQSRARETSQEPWRPVKNQGNQTRTRETRQKP